MMIDSILFKPIFNPTGEKESEIKKFVSYIYYPYQRSPIGHSELEIEGNSYVLTSATSTSIKDIITQRRAEEQGPIKIKPLSNMIKRTESKVGLPFFRFNISVTPQQLEQLREGVSKINSLTCSLGVAAALEHCAGFEIPLPLAISPSASAFYLTAANKLGSRRVYQIESYGNPNLPKFILAIAIESIALLSVVRDSLLMRSMEYLVPSP